jgi:hypothetical protein
MKPKVLSFLLIIGTGLFLAACQKEKQPDTSVLKMDDTQILLSCLVSLDDNGNIAEYMIGTARNPSKPGDITIRCDSYEKAREIFSDWVPEGADIAESEDAVTWSLTDTLGVSQGSAVLKAGSSGAVVAQLELPASFPVVTSVQFARMFQAELDFSEELEDFYFLNVVNIPSSVASGHGNGKFVVIREYDQDTNTCGILLATPDKEYNAWWDDDPEHWHRARWSSDLFIVGKQYRKYPDVIDKVLASLGYASGDHWYLCCEKGQHWWEDDYLRYRYNLRTEEYQFRNGLHPCYYEAYVYFFGMKKDGDTYKLKFW